MSGIVGIVNLKHETDKQIGSIADMLDSISHRGRKNQKFKNCTYGLFGGCESISFSCKDEQIPLSATVDQCEYTICFDGLIYNSNEIKKELICRGIDAENMNDARLVLSAYIKWGVGCLRRLNGIFAFTVWNAKTRELFLARDRFGIKPLYYSRFCDSFVFASELKALLKHPEIIPELDKDGLCEVLGLGPAQSQGTGVFKGIYEISPGCCATYNLNGFYQGRYWNLVSKSYGGSFDECCEHVRKLTHSAIDSQLEDKGRELCFFLSGGLDSSIITALASQKLGPGINTFSLEYAGNEEYFEPNEYQPASDGHFIDLMSESFKTNHHRVVVNNQDLVEFLYNSMKARDLPGMADVDSSLYFLCKKMGEEFDGALSGECADEVFGGYPWFHREEDFKADIFPWAKNVELRRSIVNSDILSPDCIEDYIRSKYRQSILACPVCNDDNETEKRRREIAYLNLNWFMYTLGARSERIGMNCGLEIRMPFCDHRLVEYLWNVPWEYKAYNNREKGLLRMCFEDVLPHDVLWRKKSPFPKTHNPGYEVMVRDAARDILGNKNSKIYDIINKEYIFSLMDQPSDYSKPWFGQLMATPQLYGYIIQLEMWLNEYNIKINI